MANKIMHHMIHGDDTYEIVDKVARETSAVKTDKYVISGKTIESKRLKESSYTNETILKKPMAYYYGDTDYTSFQSATYVDSLDHIVLGFTKSDYSKGMLVEVDKDFTTIIRRVSDLDIGHCNDITYNPNSDRLYAATMYPASNTNNISVINPSTLTVESTMALGTVAYQISYDPINNIYYVGTSTLDIYDSAFNKIKSITIETLASFGITDTNQGSYCLDGTFLLMSQDAYNSYIRSFDLYDGHIVQYQSYANSSRIEEVEAMVGINNNVYTVSGQFYLYVKKLFIFDSSSNISIPNVFFNGKHIENGSDLDDYLLEGKYYYSSGSDEATLLHTPEELGSGFSLYVVNQGIDWLVQCIVENSKRKKVFFRAYERSAGFGPWKFDHRNITSIYPVDVNETYQIPSDYLTYYDYVIISCNRGNKFGSVTVPTISITKGDVASGTVVMASLTEGWSISISNTGLITMTAISSGLYPPYVKVIAN